MQYIASTLVKAMLNAKVRNPGRINAKVAAMLSAPEIAAMDEAVKSKYVFAVYDRGIFLFNRPNSIEATEKRHAEYLEAKNKKRIQSKHTSLVMLKTFLNLCLAYYERGEYLSHEFETAAEAYRLFEAGDTYLDYFNSGCRSNGWDASHILAKRLERKCKGDESKVTYYHWLIQYCKKSARDQRRRERLKKESQARLNKSAKAKGIDAFI